MYFEFIPFHCPLLCPSYQILFLIFLFIYLFNVYKYFVYFYVCVSHACHILAEARRRCQIPWDCSYRQLLVTISVLGIEPRFSGRATSALNCWAISLVLMSFSCVHTLSHLIRVTCMNIGRDLLLELGQLTSTTVLWNMTTLLYQPLAAYNSSGWRGVS